MICPAEKAHLSALEMPREGRCPGARENPRDPDV